MLYSFVVYRLVVPRHSPADSPASPSQPRQGYAGQTAGAGLVNNIVSLYVSQARMCLQNVCKHEVDQSQAPTAEQPLAARLLLGTNFYYFCHYSRQRRRRRLRVRGAEGGSRANEVFAAEGGGGGEEGGEEEDATSYEHFAFDLACA